MATMFEYAVILNEKRDKEGEITEEAEIIVPVKTVLARDKDQAQMLAARSIPDELVSNGKLDRLVGGGAPFLSEEADEDVYDKAARRLQSTHVSPGWKQQPIYGTTITNNTAIPGVQWGQNVSQANYVSAASLVNK